MTESFDHHDFGKICVHVYTGKRKRRPDKKESVLVSRSLCESLPSPPSQINQDAGSKGSEGPFKATLGVCEGSEHGACRE